MDKESCVCPLGDHRQEPIKMREKLGLSYNIEQTHGNNGAGKSEEPDTLAKSLRST